MKTQCLSPARGWSVGRCRALTMGVALSLLLGANVFAEDVADRDASVDSAARRAQARLALLSKRLPPTSRPTVNAAPRESTSAMPEALSRLGAAIEAAAAPVAAEKSAGSSSVTKPKSPVAGASKDRIAAIRAAAGRPSAGPHRRTAYQAEGEVIDDQLRNAQPILEGGLEGNIEGGIEGLEDIPADAEWIEDGEAMAGEGRRGLFGRRRNRDCAGCGNCGPLWIRAEYLFWTMEGYDTPPLVTTSAAGTDRTRAGILGLTSTSVLFDGDDLQDQFRHGGRATLGWWLDARDHIGLQASYFGFENTGETFSVASPGTPIIARPFANVEPGFEGEDAELVAYPGLFLGGLTIDSRTSMQGLEGLVRLNLAESCSWRVDGLAGYRYARLKDRLTIHDNRTVISTNTGLAIGTTFEEFDYFATANEFHGGEVGFVAVFNNCRWFAEGTLKLAIGNNRSGTEIAGQSVATVPQANGAPVATTTNAGLLAQRTNIGVYRRDEFAVIPEVGATVGYNITPCLRATLGYTFIYWTSVQRPGAQIDRDLNLSQLGVAGLNGLARPAYQAKEENVWLQGVSVGLDWQF